METMWSEAIGSINGYVSKLKPGTNVVLDLFDSVSYDEVRSSKAKEWKPVNPAENTPRGGTPLYDACARIMSKAEQANAKKTVLVVMTDGFENASRETTQAQIKDRVTKWETDRKWEVVFLGAEFKDAEVASAGIGIMGSKTLNRSVGNFDYSMDLLNAKTAAYGATGQSFTFTATEKTLAVSKTK